MIGRWFTPLCCLLFSIVLCYGQTSYFPGVVFHDEPAINQAHAEWFSRHLRALGEQPLLSSEGTAYRLLWLRSFHHPIAVRLDVNKDGSGQLHVKMTNGQGGYKPEELVEDRSFAVGRKQVAAFQAKIRKADFWHLATQEEEPEGVIRLDGAQWMLEGIDDGRYHLVDRWGPERGPYRAACLFLLELSRLKPSPVY